MYVGGKDTAVEFSRSLGRKDDGQGSWTMGLLLAGASKKIKDAFMPAGAGLTNPISHIRDICRKCQDV